MILIVGGHPDYQDQRPDHDQKWVMHHSFERDADLAFEMHTRDRWRSRIEHLNGFSRVMMQAEFPEVERSEEYPLTEVYAFCGAFLTSTIAYMVALALYQRKDVAVWGVAGDTEVYEFQIPTLCYLAGMAKGMGLKFIAHPESKLHRVLHPCARYGYDGCGELFK